MSGGIRVGVAVPSDPLVGLGDPGEAFRGPAVPFIRLLVNVLREQFSMFIHRDTAVPYFYLQSPSGKTFMITVSDTGTLQATNARG